MNKDRGALTLLHAACYIRFDRFDGTTTTTRNVPLDDAELEALKILTDLIARLQEKK